MVTRRGVALLELTVALALVTLVVIAATALLLRQARDARDLYEERVAFEAASGLVARLEASGFDVPDGRSEPAASSPGLENLRGAKAILDVEAFDGGRRARVEVAWTSFRGLARRAEIVTYAGRRP
jgi:Tfp pilus assembly protein PilX